MKMRRTLFVAFAVLTISACNRDPKLQRDRYFSEGQRYLTTGRYSEANIQFRNALQADERHIPSYLGLAEVFKKTGDDEAAINVYRKVVSLDEANVEARLEVGRYFLGAATQNPKLFKTVEAIALEVIALEPSNIEARVLLGNAYSGLGEIEKSLKELETAAGQDPEYLTAALSLGAAQLRANRVDEAGQIFKRVLEKHSDSLEATLAMATYLAGTQRFDEAETYFEKAFDLSPADPRSLNGLASFYTATKRISQAENVFKEAIARAPDSREPYWGLANFYFQQRDHAKGMAALLDLLKARPGDRPAQLRLAESYLNSNDQARAEERIRSVLATYPNDAMAHALHGRLLRERNELDKAAAAFDAAIGSDDSLIPPYIEKANLQMGTGDLDRALETLMLALQRDKNNLLVRGFLAKILALQQKPQDALREAAIVLAATPDNEDAIVARGDALLSLGNPAEAANQFRKLTELRPGHPFYWHRLGLTEAAQGDAANAIARLRKAVELKPDLAAAVQDLMLLHIRLKQYDVALADLARLPDSALPADQLHRLRGEIYAAKRDTTAAELEFRKAIERNPDSYANYMSLAELSFGRGDLAQAEREIDQLIAKNNGVPQAYFMKAYFLQLTNDTAGAVVNYRKASELDPENPEAANNLAWLLSGDAQYLGEALGLAEKARRMRPTDPEFADTLGWVHYKMKNYRLAVDQLLFSVNNRPQPGAEHYFRLGLAYRGQGDRRTSDSMFRKALQIDPSFADAPQAHRLLASGTKG